MTKLLIAIVTVLGLASITPANSARGTEAPTLVKLWRLDCGAFTAPRDNFSDFFAHPNERASYVDSCYLIRHGNDLMLWDAGLPLALKDQPEDNSVPVRMGLRISIADQLAQLGFKVADVTILGLSHNHSDHTGQADVFTKARLIMDKADFEALQRTPAPFFTERATLRPWLTGNSMSELISGDHDVFGDGSVVLVALPGHTPGNHGLLVRLAHAGVILLSGDALHTPEQLSSHALPPSNPSRADSLASLDRIAGIVRDAHATLVIQHDPASVEKLPAFPRSAE